MKKLFPGILLILIVVSGQIFAQDFNDYHVLQSQGKVPESFLKSSKQKSYEEIGKTIYSNRSQPYKRKKKEFLLGNNFLIDELLLSGKVLFNDPVGEYVNKVVDTLLKEDPELRKQIEVFVVKSSVVNAFTTSRGTIFINLGLIAKLKNEAQLAFVLSHEIIHFRNKHVMTEFEQSETMRREKGAYRNTTVTEQALAKSMFSRELETEADIQGLKIYLKSKYKVSELKGVFDALQYAHLPYGNVRFDKSFLEANNYKLPGSYQLKDTRPVKSDDKADTFSSHPRTRARRDTIQRLIKGMSDSGKVEYIVSKDGFLRIREIARFDITDIYLQNRMYEAAIYNAYLLSKDYPNNKYLETCVMKALYGLNKYSSEDDGRFSQVHDDFNEVQGKKQEVNYLFSKMESREISVLALNYAWRMKQKYPADSEIAAITEDDFKVLVDNYFGNKNYFSDKPDTTVHTDTLARVIDFKSTSGTNEITYKGIHIKLNSMNDEDIVSTGNKNTIPPYLKYAFVDFMNNDDFRKYYDNIARGRKQRTVNNKTKHSLNNGDQWRRIVSKEIKKGHPMGLKKVVFVNPFYYKIDVRHNMTLRFVASEEAQKDFNTTVRRLASRSGLDYAIIDKKNLEENGANAFNDIARLSNWVEEFYQHGDDMNFVNYKSDEFKDLIKRYGTEYFCWTGIVSVRVPSGLAFGKLVLSCIVPPLIPYAAYKTFEAKYVTYQFSIVINLATGTTEYMQSHEYKIQDRGDVIKSSLYDFFNQLKTPDTKDENSSN